MRAFALALTLAACCAGAVPAGAVPVGAEQPVAAPATPSTVVPAADASKAVEPRSLTLDVGRGTMVSLPEPAASVLAADPSIARVQPASPTRLFLIAVAAGHTTVIATNSAGGTISQFEVTVRGGAPVAAPSGGAASGDSGAPAADPRSAESAIAQSVHGAREVRVRAAGKDLVLTGVVPTPAAAQEAEAIARAYLGGDKAHVVNQMLVLGSIQVNVRVRFAEISRSITRELGFNWQGLTGGKGGFQFGLMTAAATAAGASAYVGGALVNNFSPLTAQGATSTLATGQPLNQIGFGSTRWDINNIIDALATDQLITILAEPNLTALSGETASFLAGGEFPIPTGSAASNQITIEFKQFGVSLSVVPTVISPDRLNLKVRPEVSELSDNGAINLPLTGGSLKVPALTVRRAETTIELGSGQSFAIAGLLQKSSSDQVNSLPGLGDLPVLGALFRSDSFQRAESELVIIVTPYLVAPVSSPGRLSAPTDGFKPATDLDRILFGRQVARGSAAGTTPIDAGFILR